MNHGYITVPRRTAERAARKYLTAITTAGHSSSDVLLAKRIIRSIEIINKSTGQEQMNVHISLTSPIIDFMLVVLDGE